MMLTTTAGTHNFRAVSSARRRSTPSVLRLRNSAPCSVKTDSDARPQTRLYGLSKSKKLPVKFMLASIGVPLLRLPKATPHSSAGTRLPMKIAQSQYERHVGLVSELRNLKATPRAMSASKITTRAR